MRNTVHTETYKGLTIHIHSDYNAECPYDDYDMFGTMHHWHRRGFFGTDISTWESSEMRDHVADIVKKGGVVVPVWLYEHGGQTIRAGEANPFHCQWDSGQVGFWSATAEEIKAEFDGDKDKAIACIKREIETVDHYLRGNVYGFEIQDQDEMHLDSCWGYIGDYDEEGGALLEARGVADDIVAQKRTRYFSTLKAMIVHKVPLAVRAAEVAKHPLLGGCHAA